MKKLFCAMLVMVFAMVNPIAASTGSLYSVANNWYYEAAAEGVLTVSDNFNRYTYEVDQGTNFLGKQSRYTGQLRFIDFDPYNYRHIVIWDFKADLSDAEKDFQFNRMKTDLEALVDVIPGIIELRVMRDIFNPGTNGEGQVILDAIFESQATQRFYATHPAHLAIAGYVVTDIVDSQSRRQTNFIQPVATGHSDKYRHIVVWEFQPGLSEEGKDFQFNRMKNDLEALVGVIPGLVELNVVRDYINPGSVHGNGQVTLVALFDTRYDHVDVYTPHPLHQAIAGYVVAEIVDNATRRQANFYELD